jgi:hypothetical protein
MEELKEIVIKNLEEAGIIDTMRAQLRSNVFKALQNEEGSLRISKSELFKATDSETGKICAELFRDFLEFYKAEFTLNVFLPECRLPSEKQVLPSLQEKLGISPDPSVPLIFKLVQKALAPKEVAPSPKTIYLPPLKPLKPAALTELSPPQLISSEAPKLPINRFPTSDEEDPHPRLSESDDISPEKQRLQEIENKINSLNIKPIKLLDIPLNIEDSQGSTPKYSEDFE